MAFCSKCGTENKENAKFCIKCGNSLHLGVESMRQFPDYSNAPQETIKKKKSPIIAMVLNFVIAWGLGYWYLGIKKVWGLPWYSLFIVEILLAFIVMNIEGFGIIFTLLNFALAYDVYQKALSKPGFVPIG